MKKVKILIVFEIELEDGENEKLLLAREKALLEVKNKINIEKIKLVK